MPIASGSGTQQYRMIHRGIYPANGDDLDDFFAGIHERSRSHRMRPTIEDTTDALGLFNLSSHPAIAGSKFSCPEEWFFEEGGRVTVSL
jgi:hypothetical protein